MNTMNNISSIQTSLESSGWLGRGKHISNYARCLIPLLSALQWQGEIDRICESLPHYPEAIDQIDFINTMVNLGFTVKTDEIRLRNFDDRLGACLFVINTSSKDDRIFILIPDGDGLQDIHPE